MNTGRLLLAGAINLKIKDKALLKYTNLCMDRFPTYFWTAPSSLDYHPKDERSTGGLVLHTGRIIKAITHLINFYELTDDEGDILYSAAILHDSFHKGLDKKDNADINHPIIAVSKFPFDEKIGIKKETHAAIMDCVVSHMGRHSTHPSLNIDSKLTNIFKLADFFVSRENVTIS